MIDKDHRCHGCGAPIKGRTCEYCRRVFADERITYGQSFCFDRSIINYNAGYELGWLQYQVSQERQMSLLMDNLRKSNNVAAYDIAPRIC